MQLGIAINVLQARHYRQCHACHAWSDPAASVRLALLVAMLPVASRPCRLRGPLFHIAHRCFHVYRLASRVGSCPCTHAHTSDSVYTCTRARQRTLVLCTVAGWCPRAAGRETPSPQPPPPCAPTACPVSPAMLCSRVPPDTRRRLPAGLPPTVPTPHPGRWAATWAGRWSR